ncbi:MAG: hypothetical protein KatS3mg057_2212 [Herpetosiphonaceae bacterium]|nr:MAG: hypothetical protein KatS3mg057_2212 [Herpetosiphonaceae bacterium]
MCCPPSLRAAFDAAAILETFDTAALMALLDEPDENIPGQLITAGLILEEGGNYRVDQGPQTEALLAMAPARKRQLHRRAALYYASLLAAGHDGVERAYMHHLEHLCEILIRQEPAALAQAVSAAPFALLTQPRHRHLLQYYRGLGQGLQDRFAAARAEFDRLLAEPDLDDAIRARTLNSDAIFARLQGDYQHALTGYEESYAIWARLGDKVRQGSALKNMGILYYELRDYARAETAFRESARLFAEAEASYFQGTACNELGLLYRDQGRWDEALSLLEQAAEIFEREEAGDFLGRANNNIGEVELLRGNIAAATARFEQALHQMSTRTYAVDVLVNLGLASQARGDHQTALEHYDAALELALALDRREILALIHARIAHASWQLNRLDQAHASYSAAVAAIEAARKPLHDQGLLVGLLGRWQNIYEAALLLSLERGAAESAFGYAEQARARAFADALARHDEALSHERAVPLTAQEVMAALPAGTLLLCYFTTGLGGLETALLNAMPPEATSVRACLDLPRRLVLFAVSSAEIRPFICPIDPATLQTTSSFLSDGRRFLRPAVLRRCYDALITPLGDWPAGITRVVVIPHGPLHQIPFAALLDPAGRPLIEQLPCLAYAPSATVLLTARPVNDLPARDPCLALGYDGTEGSDLRHTAAEAEEIARLCGGVAWRGSTGIVRRLIRHSNRYRWLHLACHGEFIPDDPLASWLEIGPGERLSAAEVLARLRLRADLVTLSACRSGVSKVLQGDEPMGLVRAFLSAGARAVLVTLWPVEDLSARLLMVRFYTTLLAADEQTDPAVALREAQQWLRELTADTVRRQLEHWGGAGACPEGEHPYAAADFWAPYVLIAGAVPILEAGRQPEPSGFGD